MASNPRIAKIQIWRALHCTAGVTLLGACRKTAGPMMLRITSERFYCGNKAKSLHVTNDPRIWGTVCMFHVMTRVPVEKLGKNWGQAARALHDVLLQAGKE